MRCDFIQRIECLRCIRHVKCVIGVHVELIKMVLSRTLKWTILLHHILSASPKITQESTAASLRWSMTVESLICCRCLLEHVHLFIVEFSRMSVGGEIATYNGCTEVLLYRRDPCV